MSESWREPKKCMKCGSEFTPNRPRRKYCYKCSPKNKIYPPYMRKNLKAPTWLQQRNLENILHYFRDELIQIKKGKAPKLTTGERHTLLRYGFVSYKSGKAMSITDYCKNRLEAVK